MDKEEREETLRTTYEELKDTHQNQLESHRNLNQRAIDLAKIDILAASVVASAISFSQLANSLILMSAALISLVLSISFCAFVYKPREFPNGLSPDAGSKVRSLINNGGTLTQFYNKMIYEFRTNVNGADRAYNKEVQHFRNGLWASIGALLFFIASLYPFVSPIQSTGLDILFIFLIGMGVIGVSTLSGEDETT